jgi:hypothetical protein
LFISDKNDIVKVALTVRYKKIETSNMPKLKRFMARGTIITLAGVLVGMTLLAVLFWGEASAGIPTQRSITISSSAASATDVTYTVHFHPLATTDHVEGLVLDFCGDSPIIGGATCSAIADLDVKTHSSLANQVGVVDWEIVGASSTTTKLVLSRTGGAADTAASVSFDVLAVDNPSATNTTFYTRLLTFSTDALAAAYTSATPGTYVDAGGIALSTANQLNILAIVQERLTFCVYTGANCGAGGSSIDLGDVNHVLDSSHSYTDINAKFDIATNALGGANVVLKGATLTSGGFSITAIGAASAASSTGTEQFGMCLWQSSGSGFTPAAPYSHASCSTVTTGMDLAGVAQFAFDSAVTGGASGDDIGTKVAGTTSQATLAFLGNIAWTTEAGIYQTALTLVATGTY